MPNPANITAPFILIAPPRSGTTLLQALINASGQVDCVGETIEMLFGVWRSVQLTDGQYGIVRPAACAPGRSFDDILADSVRHCFLERFPAPQPRWFMKLLGISRSIILAGLRPDDLPDPGWYWRVLNVAFPQARFLTILRNPCDVVLSTKKFSGFSQQDVWWSLGALAHVLSAPEAPPVYPVVYDRLVEHYAVEVAKLFAYLELPFDPGILATFDAVYAPADDRTQKPAAGFSRQADWAALDPAALSAAVLPPLRRLFDKFDLTFPMPDQIRRRFADGPTAPTRALGAVATEGDDAPWTVASLRRKVVNLNEQLFQMSEQYTRKLTEISQHDERTFQEQQAWIKDREEAIAWHALEREKAAQCHEEQRRALLNENESLKGQSAELSKECQALRTEIAALRAGLTKEPPRAATA
jgi:hypothetical protein